MNLRKAFIGICITCGVASCYTETWYHTPTGLDYRIITSSNKDSVIRMGQTAKIEVTQKVGDSVMETTIDKMPLYYMVMPGFGNRYNPLEVFDYGLHKGDSVVTLQLVDSMLHKKIFDSIPHWMKKGDQWITILKVLDVFVSDSLLQKDKQKEALRVTELQTALSKKRIESWLQKNDIKAIPSGDVFTEIRTQGNGSLADSGKRLSLQFEVRTLRGKLLNSTTDTSFHQQGPKEIVIGKATLPPVLEKEIEKMRQGTVACIYAPAVKLFGVNPQAKLIHEDDDIIFTITLVQVKD